MSLEDIQKEYKIKIEAQQDPEKRRDLELEEQRAIGQFLQGEIRRKDQDIWRKEALVEFPYAFPNELQGDTPEAVKAAAKASHDRFNAKLAEELAAKEAVLKDQIGKQAWGSATGGGGQTTTIGPDPKQETEQIYQSLKEGKMTPYQEKRLRELRLGPMFDRMAKDLVGQA